MIVVRRWCASGASHGAQMVRKWCVSWCADGAQVMAADPGVKALKGHGKGPGRGHKTPVNNNSFKKSTYGSTNQPYLIRRLKRDRPDIAEALCSQN